ncbi:MAG: MFS transporter, partial [Bradyrhizobium sp.]|nr:MFS transporter [Bradyrhizobium sp.]
MRATRRSNLGVILALGTTQTIAWASSYYLPAILAAPIARDLEVTQTLVFGALSGALVISGILGPRIGHTIDMVGGRGMLAVSNGVLALGLGLLSVASGPALLFAAWIVIGVGMGMGLYEAAFATLTRIYGMAARKPITGITLIAGFASTIGWPLTAWLEARYGWRVTCQCWALIHLLLALPLNLTLPRATAPVPVSETPIAPRTARETSLITIALAYV